MQCQVMARRVRRIFQLRVRGEQAIEWILNTRSLPGYNGARQGLREVRKRKWLVLWKKWNFVIKTQSSSRSLESTRVNDCNCFDASATSGGSSRPPELRRFQRFELRHFGSRWSHRRRLVCIKVQKMHLLNEITFLGENTTMNEFPWAARLGYDSLGETNFDCGGTVISGN